MPIIFDNVRPSFSKGGGVGLYFYAFLLNYDVCKRGTHNFKDVPKKTLCFPGRGGGEGIYEDVKGFCNSASIKRVRKLGYVLTPGRYVGLPDGDFKVRFSKLKAEFAEQLKEEARLNALIAENLAKVKING